MFADHQLFGTLTVAPVAPILRSCLTLAKYDSISVRLLDGASSMGCIHNIIFIIRSPMWHEALNSFQKR